MTRLGPVILIVEDEFLLRLDSAETIGVGRASSDARHRISSRNGGDHAADDRFRRQCFRSHRAAAPGTVFNHPRDVVAHPSLSISEKRAILASWAPDASAIASCPTLRAPVRLKAPVTIDEILQALCELDGGPRHPPGGRPNRLCSTSRAWAA
jgi:hypothetical protein